MKGYATGYGCMGFIPSLNRYFLYATEEEYKEYFYEGGRYDD